MTDPESLNPTSYPLDPPQFITPVFNSDTKPGDSWQTQQIIAPNHYNDTAISALQVIDAWEATFRVGNALKYLCRHNKKGNALADLKKAAEYIRLEIERLEA